MKNRLKSDNIWFTSDTHYSHSNICRGVSNWGDVNLEGVFEVDENSTRNFLTVESMNENMVKNINSFVDSNDWLIHLGDWSFGEFEMIEEFREKINCKNITLILGNHDYHIQENKNNIQRIFRNVAHYEELSVSRESNQNIKTKFILFHYPIVSWNYQFHNSIMLHGHQHLKGDNRITQKNRMDVGLCGSPEFRPYHIEEIISHINLKNK